MKRTWLSPLGMVALVTLGCGVAESVVTEDETEAGSDGAGASTTGMTPVGTTGSSTTTTESSMSSSASPSTSSSSSSDPTETTSSTTSSFTTSSDCAAGSANCVCYGNGTCDEGLTCEDGECQSCSQGSLGCPCYGNGTCDGTFSCIDEVCRVELVQGSTSGGPGGSGGSGGSTGDDLGGTTGGDTTTTTGDDTTTTTGGDTTTTGDDGNCVAGSEDCPCYGNGTCDDGLVCDDSDTCIAPVTCEVPTMIDDLEDGDGSICVNQGRAGGWFTFASDALVDLTPANTPTGIDPVVVNRGSSVYAMRAVGTGFSDDDWGVLGLSLHPDGPYDASGFRGVRFWARGNTTFLLHVHFTTDATRPIDQDGECIGDDLVPCNDHYGRYLTIGTSWQEYIIVFADTEQRGWGVLAPRNFDEMHTIHFQYEGSGSAVIPFDNPANFELFVDDFEFVE